MSRLLSRCSESDGKSEGFPPASNQYGENFTFANAAFASELLSIKNPYSPPLYDGQSPNGGINNACVPRGYQPDFIHHRNSQPLQQSREMAPAVVSNCATFREKKSKPFALPGPSLPYLLAVNCDGSQDTVPARPDRYA